MKRILLLGFCAGLAAFLVSRQGGRREAPAHPAPDPLLAAAIGNPTKPADGPVIRNLDPAQAQELLARKKGITILDVRTPGEFKAGHLAGATNLNYNAPDFAEQLKKLDKNKDYFIYCRSGRRSGAARKLMNEQGFQSIYHLDGGILAWEKAGKPTAK